MGLRAAREKIGKTQARVAEESGVSVRLYQYYEAGEKKPTVTAAIRIANAMGVKDLRELFGS